MTLAEFLLARYAEEATILTESIGDEAHQRWALEESADLNEAYIVSQAQQRLADIARKRRIVERHDQKTGEYLPTHPICAECGGADWRPLGKVLRPYTWVMPWPCPTLRILGEEFAGHPGYDPAWRAT